MALGALFGKLFRAAASRDGQAPGVEAMAGEGHARLLDAMASGDAMAGVPAGVVQGSAALVGDAAGDRASGAHPPARRALQSPRAILEDRTAQKVLHAWLQNRNQTLLPLAINLRSLSADAKALLMQAMATAIGAGAPMPQGRRERLNAWLSSVGGTEADRLALAKAIARPIALPLLLEQAAAAKLAPAVYAISVAALDQGDAVNTLYLDYLAAKLAIPVTVVRSAARRYRM